MAYTTIDDPTDYFNTVIYAGTGSSHAITVGFQPDWVWIKNRDAGNDHNSYDSIRGATKDLNNNTTNAESTIAEGLKSFDSNGFTVGTNTAHNGGSENYVSWNWLAGGTASSNSNGSITSSVSASTTAGFSIVSYTGTGSTATIGHGLSSTPQVVLIKCRSDATNWHMYHSSVTTADNQVMYLDLNYALSTLTTSSFDVSEFSSSVFGLNTNDAVNGSGRTYIAYCFAEKKGFSKFGSYQGNSSADGTFVYTGFKPAWVVIKRTDTTGNWHMLDNKRDPINEADATLLANVSDVEFQSTNDVDFLSNGFKLRANQTSTNVGTYIYMAFAESPFVNSNGVPTNAR